MSSRVTHILTEALAPVPEADDLTNERIYRQLAPELNEHERDELALTLLSTMRERYPDTPPETLLSVVVFGFGVGRAVERLHRDGEL